AVEADDGSGVENDTAALADHHRRDRLGAVKDALQIDVDHQVELLHRHLLHQLAVLDLNKLVVAGDAGVVDQHVDAPMLGDDRVYPRLHSRAVGDVYTGEEGALAEGGGGFAAGCFVQVTEGDGGPFGDELLRRGPANARGAARNQADSVLHGHALSPCDGRFFHVGGRLTPVFRECRPQFSMKRSQLGYSRHCCYYSGCWKDTLKRKRWMKVHFYATLRPIAGQKTVEFDLGEGVTVQELVDAVVTRFPPMRE